MIRPVLYGTALLSVASSFCYSTVAHANGDFPTWMGKSVNSISSPHTEYQGYSVPRYRQAEPRRTQRQVLHQETRQEPRFAPQQRQIPQYQPPVRSAPPQANNHFIQQPQGYPAPRLRLASYSKPAPFGHSAHTPAYSQRAGNSNCNSSNAQNLNAHCLQRGAAIKRGLMEQAKYLKRHNPNLHKGKSWANVSNGELLSTVNKLLAWHDGKLRGSLPQHFELRTVNAASNQSGAKYTGYITPLLDVKRTRDNEFRIPIYKSPQGGTTLSHAAISEGGLQGKGLEVAWTNDPINLYFAQIQGSAIARFPDGREAMLTYSGNNGKSYRSIARYLRDKGYKSSGFGNESIRQWLKANPGKIAEVMHSNPRFVFFDLKEDAPQTASGAHVIPGHTIAVDDQYIPLGSVLLAEVPRVDTNGNTVGKDWRLLFAQDKGAAIKGAGRIDLYLGAGASAEKQAHQLTGYRKTYMLLDRSSGHLARL